MRASRPGCTGCTSRRQGSESPVVSASAEGISTSHPSLWAWLGVPSWDRNQQIVLCMYIYIYIYILFVCEGMTFAWPFDMCFKGIVNINRDVKSEITMNHCGSGVFKQWQCGISPCHCDLFSQVRSHFHRLNSLCTYFCLKKPWTLRFWLLTLQIFVH